MQQKKIHVAFLMETALGWKSTFLLWQRLMKSDTVEPHWISADGESRFDWIHAVPGMPKQLLARLRSFAVIRDRFQTGSFDANYLGAMALLPLIDKLTGRPTYTVLDSTQKLLQDFGPIYGNARNKNPLIELSLHALRSRAYQSCAGLFAYSQWAKDSLTVDYGVKSETVRVLPPGVDLDVWKPDQDVARRRPQNAVKDILFVGGDFERKGGLMLLEWAKKQSRTDYRLHIVTRYHPTELFDSRVVFYHGLTPGDSRLVSLYKNADIFVLPTLAECYGIVGCEALAGGIPTVMTCVGGSEGIVKHNETGLLVPPGDVGALNNHLSTLLDDDDLRLRMGQAARADAERRFDVRTAIKTTLAVICGET